MGVESNPKLRAELLKIKTTCFKAWGQFVHFSFLYYIGILLLLCVQTGGMGFLSPNFRHLQCTLLSQPCQTHFIFNAEKQPLLRHDSSDPF